MLGSEPGIADGINQKSPAFAGLFRCQPGRLTGAVYDAALAEVVGSQLNLDLVTSQNADVVLTHFSGDVCSHNVAVGQLNAL